MFRTKVENQLLGWLQKFDQDVGEKQAEEEEVQGHLDAEKKQLDRIQVRLVTEKTMAINNHCIQVF